MPRKQTPRAAIKAELAALLREQRHEKAAAEKAVRKIQSDKTKALAGIDRLLAKAAKDSAAIVKRCDREAARLAKAYAANNKALTNRLAILEARLHA